MNIILGQDNAAEIGKKYTLLELDTLRIDSAEAPVTAYCLIETVNITDLAITETLKDHHARLMKNYKTRQWHQCLQDIESLRGCWSGQVDSFYEEIDGRVRRFLESDPGEDWDPVLNKLQS
jgi:hypothetical protein